MQQEREEPRRQPRPQPSRRKVLKELLEQQRRPLTFPEPPPAPWKREG